MATKLKTVEQIIDDKDAESNNLRFWTQLGRTDPAHTKQFKRAGGFSGTAVKPMWVNKRLTEMFGPAGIGWGAGKPDFEVLHGDNKEVLVYCTVSGWYRDPTTGERHEMFGVGGDKVVSHIKANRQYNRPERWENDDEAFKKAYTDALGNAFKFVGVGADVHMGLFDDSKYVAEVREEFQPKPDNPTTGEEGPRKTKLDGPYDTIPKLEKAAKEFVRSLNGMGTLAEFDEWKQDPEVQAFVEQCKRDLPSWWFADHPECPPNFTPLAVQAINIRRGLAALEKETA